MTAAAPTWAGVFHPASGARQAVAGRWLVLLPGAVPASAVAPLAQELVTGRGRVERTWTSALKGFVALLPESGAEALSADPRVVGVFQDLALDNPYSAPLPDCSQGVALSAPVPSPPSPETITCDDPNPQNAAGTCTDNWGLDRLDGVGTTRDGRFAPPRLGQGVRLFLVDSGLYAQHQEFTGRVGQGYDATGTGLPVGDCDSWPHGTHVAGIAAGTRFGVAKRATLHSVRVATCPTYILLSYLVTGFDWVAQAHATTLPGPAVASLSLNSSNAEFLDPAQPLGVAVAGVLAQGVLVINSAGNQAGDACARSLAVPGTLIVGGSDELDTPWERTPGDPNYAGWCSSSGDCGTNAGSCVHLFAPSAHIVSAWFSSTPDPRHTCRLSGTSMAAPHAAGAAALFLEANPAATPAQVKQALVSRALPALSQLSTGSPNKLLTVLEGVPGLGVAPAGGLAFGAWGAGTTSTSQRVTLSSTGTRDVHVGAVTLTGAMAAEFRITGDACSGRTFAPAASCAVDLTFTPAGAGARTASLSLPSDDPTRPVQTVALSGTGELPTLTVQKAGSGGGAVQSSPAGIACGAACSAPFTPGTSVTLSAQPQADSVFIGWSGVAGCLTTTGPCQLTLTASTRATAIFGLAPPDAGPEVDAGSDDAGPSDAGPPVDAGVARDAGSGSGPGTADGGTTLLAVHGVALGCGCGTGSAVAPWLALLALARRRWRPRGRNSAPA